MLRNFMRMYVCGFRARNGRPPNLRSLCHSGWLTLLCFAYLNNPSYVCSIGEQVSTKQEGLGSGCSQMHGAYFVAGLSPQMISA